MLVKLDFAELLEELLDDDEVLPAGGKLLGLQQDLVGEGVLGGFGHVEVLEGVELPHAHGGGDGELEVAGLGVGVGRPELDPAEGEALLDSLGVLPNICLRHHFLFVLLLMQDLCNKSPYFLTSK